MLIVSTLTSLADIPKYFTRLFDDEVIELEPEKQNGIKEAKFIPVVVYNKSKQCLTLNGAEMPLNGKMLNIVQKLEKPQELYKILNKHYRETYRKGEKIIDSKRGTFDKAVHVLNKEWYNTFKISKELLRRA